MRVLIRLLFPFLLLAITNAKPDQCEPTPAVPPTEQDCENLTTEYEKYRECMEHRISKRSTCQNSYECNECDCNSCNSSCNDEDDCNLNTCCNSCCEQRHQQCNTYSCCHKSCRSECRSSSCRSSCRRKCQSETTKYVEKNAAQVAPSSLSSNINQTFKSDHNITTIIHLNNIINNTNLIHLPVNVNNTNVNNITVETSNPSGGAERIIFQQIPGMPGAPGIPGAPGSPGLPGLPGVPGTSSRTPSTSSSSSSSSCCLTVGPKQCVRQKEFPFVKCYHIRKKSCGAMCTAPVVHYQKHEVCDNDVETKQPCKEQTVYIPQPQPRCAYQETWPYVTCDGYQTPSCDGCYFNREEGSANCSPFCYDDGYGIGPYFRQGPLYRPGYSHVPSCVQTGTCGMDFNYPGAVYNGDSINFAVEPIDSNQTPEDSPKSAVGIDSTVLFKNLQSKEELNKNQAEIKIVPEVNK